MHDRKTAGCILHIDDDRDLSANYARVLEQAGYRVRHAATGDEGISMARRERPDAILLDWMMPGKNGFETCVELRRIASLRDVPIIALTAFGRNIPLVHAPNGDATALQVQDCLEKPVEINILLNRIETLLAEARLAVEVNSES